MDAIQISKRTKCGCLSFHSKWLFWKSFTAFFFKITSLFEILIVISNNYLSQTCLRTHLNPLYVFIILIIINSENKVTNWKSSTAPICCEMTEHQVTVISCLTRQKTIIQGTKLKVNPACFPNLKSAGYHQLDARIFYIIERKITDAWTAGTTCPDGRLKRFCSPINKLWYE